MPQSIKRRLLRLLLFIKPVLIIGVILILIGAILQFTSPVRSFIKQNNITPGFVIGFLFDAEPNLKKYQGRTNIVLLGIGGGTHEGADLTDSVILLSLDFTKKDAAIISIPRDLWLPSLKDRINTAYHYGEEKKKEGGLLLAKSAVEEVVGVPVHYAWVIDFAGFKRLIDLAGGIDIEVEQAFTDKLYPIEGKENDFCGGDPEFACRYETVHFDNGWQHMDGERALKYVRTRHAEGDEGNDFARSRRQQQVMVALKNKILKMPLWKDPKRIKELFTAFDDATDTDMNWSEQIIFLKHFIKLSDGQLRHIVLDDGDKEKKKRGFLLNPPLEEYNGLWVLAPRTGNFREIQEYIACHLINPNCTIQP